MGQFSSRLYDGDPYIDLMRALPERELIWWVQKVIWLAEGFTLFDHFRRTYPTIFLNKCVHCNGAGIVTCPHCQGYKLKILGSPQSFKLSERTSTGRISSVGEVRECHHCGTYCSWDEESDWGEKWSRWDKVLAYYDRSLGPLMDEFYEDIVNEGKLEEDTPYEEEKMPDPKNNSLMAKASREVASYKERMRARLKYFGGHPYLQDDMVPYKMVDPAKSFAENAENIELYKYDLPPELHPEVFPEFLFDPESPYYQLEKQIEKEHMLLNNLDAAMRDMPKPAQFPPTAGTIPCPDCQGQPWWYTVVPNVAKLTRSEIPFWMRTLQNMNSTKYDGHSAPKPVPGGPRLSFQEYGEYPRHPLSASQLMFTLESQVRSGQEEYFGREGRPMLWKALKAHRFRNYLNQLTQPNDLQPSWLKDYGTRLVADADEEPLEGPDLAGSAKPLQLDWENTLDTSRVASPLVGRLPETPYVPNHPSRVIARDILFGREPETVPVKGAKA